MKERPELLSGFTLKARTACGPIYITINDDEDGKPFEVFVSMGKAGGCASAQEQALGRLLSWGLRSGAYLHEAAKQLRGIGCHLTPKDDETPIHLKKRACSDVVAIAIIKYLRAKKYPCADNFLGDKEV